VSSAGDDGKGPGPGPGPEGWEGFAEEASEGTLGPSQELEEAMREAAEAHDARVAERQGRRPEAAAGPASPADDAALAEARRELAELRERYLRLAADFDNARKRGLKDREEAALFGHQNLVKELLPSVDNLERAIDSAQQGGEGGREALLEGVELVLREIQTALARHGVVAIDASGQPFDPALHEAMAQVPDASVPANTVVQVFQRGYQLRGRLLRPARVVVSKPPLPAEKDGDEST
jgi:molecular chaperone GrpE